MSTLTTKYVDAVLRHAPEGSRAEIRAEVSEVISEMLHARLGDHLESDQISRNAAERAVLEELGDPARLSRRYTEAPQHLIGPGFYPLYQRVLLWLMPILGVLALLTNGIIRSITEPEPHIGGVIGASIGSTFIALLIAFAAITIGTAVLERVVPVETVPGLPTDRQWSVEQLETPSGHQRSVRAEAGLGMFMLILLALIPLLPTSLFYMSHLNDGETFVNPDLPSGWLVGYWAFLAAVAVTEIWKMIQGRLTAASTTVSIAVDLLGALFLTIAFITQDVLHPQLADAAGYTLGAWPVLLGIWVITVWDQVNTMRAYRAYRNVGP